MLRGQAVGLSAARGQQLDSFQVRENKILIIDDVKISAPMIKDDYFHNNY